MFNMSINEKAPGSVAPPPHPNPLGGNRNEYYTHTPVGSEIYDNTRVSFQPPSPQPAGAQGNMSLPRAPPSNVLRPFHHLAYKLGSESALPQDMETEIQKATRVLHAFTTDPVRPLEPLPRLYPPAEGAEQQQQQPPAAGTSRKNHTLIPIPDSVIAGAVGLAIFTSARIGFHASLSTGSGILIARSPDGRGWGAPSAISVHSVGAGFLAGLDMSDVVYVINTEDALEAFMRQKVTLGPEAAVAAGPWGAGGGVSVVLEKCNKGQHGPRPTTEDVARDKMTRKELKRMAREQRRKAAQETVRTALRRPVYTYVRSRGLYAGLQLDGTVVMERADANKKFYGMELTAKQILNGYVPPGRWIETLGGLYGVLAEVERRAPRLPPAPAERREHVVPPETEMVARLTEPEGAHGDEQKEANRVGGQEEGWEDLPRYDDDGVTRPGVGDVKGEGH